MAIKDFVTGFFSKAEKAEAPLDFALNEAPLVEQIGNLSGDLKGIEPQKEVKFPNKLGEEHPFDFAVAEGIYKTFGKATSTVDKIVDFAVGPGWYLVSENEKARKICQDFLDDVNFDLVLRSWLKEALVKGTGFLELGGEKKDGPIGGVKVLDAKWMYIRRSADGKEVEYNQWIGGFKKFNPSLMQTWKEWQIAVLPINQIGSCPYGLGKISPVMDRINKYLEADKSMHTLLRRKANSPLWAKLGSLELKNIPTQGQITGYGQKMEYMHDKQEWATGPNVDLKVVDFGSVGEKFSFVMEHDSLFLTESWQVPEVLSGKGNIAEGLAVKQFEAFMRMIQSIQAQVEKVIENDIFRRVLLANKPVMQGHVEFEWGVPSEQDRNERIDRLGRLLQNPFMDPALKVAIEKLLAEELEIDEEDLETPSEQKGREEREPQPVLPGSNEGIDDAPLKEYLGFQYGDYLDSVLDFVAKDEFANLVASTQAEALAGKLSEKQIVALRNALRAGFINGESIRQISFRIAVDVKPGALFALDDDGSVKVGKNGRPVLRIDAGTRSLIIARTETTRSAANGALNNFKDNGIEKVQWVASTGSRTCPLCEDLNGRVFEAVKPDFLPPLHSYCRCTIQAVVE